MSANDRCGRLLFIGFHATTDGLTPTSQNELIADLLSDHGFEVRSASAKSSQVPRLLDQLSLVKRYGKWADCVVIDVFSGRRAWTPFLIARAARWLETPSILVLHGGGLPDYVRSHPRRIESTLRRASRLAAPSAYLRKAFEARGFSITELPNLVDHTETKCGENASPNSHSILWMRAFDAEYRPQLAIEALAVVRRDRPDIRLTMAGPDRGLLPKTQALVRSLDLEDCVSFPGYLDDAAKARAMKGHQVFLNTTAIDNTPVSVLEAMAAGLPVVAVDVGGISDLLDGGRAGVLVPDRGPDVLATAIADLLSDASLRHRLVKAGREVAAKFAPSAVVAGWRAMLESVGVPTAPAPLEGCAPLRVLDLRDVTRIHCEAFPESALTRFGSSVVRRYYLWQFTGPHPVPAALGCWSEGELVGYLFGGHRRGAVSGFVRRYAIAIAFAVIRRPGSVRQLALPKVRAVARGVVRKPISVPVSTAAADGGHGGSGDVEEMPERSDEYGASFGVLAIAVSGAAQGTGAGACLMASAAELASARGFARMHLTVQTENHRAIRFYEKLGWDRVADGDAWEGAMAMSIADSMAPSRDL